MCSCPIEERKNSDARREELEILAWQKAFLVFHKTARGACILVEFIFSGEPALKSLKKLL